MNEYSNIGFEDCNNDIKKQFNKIYDSLSKTNTKEVEDRKTLKKFMKNEIKLKYMQINMLLSKYAKTTKTIKI